MSGMSKASFKVFYCGPELDSGQMDVKELAPALLAAGAVLDEANRVLNGNRSSVSVKVKKFEDGSFGVSFDVWQSLTAQAVSLFSGNEVTAALNIIAVLGFAGGGAAGLVKLIKMSKGRKPRRAKTLDNGNIELDFDEGLIEVSKQVCDLYLDMKVRVELHNFSLPLARRGVDRIGIYHGREMVESITKDEAAYFLPPAAEDDLLDEREITATYFIHSLSFKDDNKWRFTDGAVTFFATIQDQLFLDRVNQNLVSFAKGDIMRVRMRTKTWNTAAGPRSEYEILEVLEHRSAAVQLRLPV